MSLKSDEAYLLGNDTNGLLVTTHRVRLAWSKAGEAHFQTIMLEELASCSLRSKSYPILLVLAGIALLVGMISMGNSRSDSGGMMAVGVIMCVLLVLAYFATRKKVVAFASAGETIFADASRMSLEEAKKVIDLVESAKNDRFMLHAVSRQSGSGFVALGRALPQIPEDAFPE